MAKKQLDSRPTNVKLGLSEVTPYSGVFKRKVKDIKDWGNTTEIVDTAGNRKTVEDF